MPGQQAFGITPKGRKEPRKEQSEEWRIIRAALEECSVCLRYVQYRIQYRSVNVGNHFVPFVAVKLRLFRIMYRLLGSGNTVDPRRFVMENKVMKVWTRQILSIIALLCAAHDGQAALEIHNTDLEKRVTVAREDAALATATRERLEAQLAELQAQVPANSNAVAAAEQYLDEVRAMESLHVKRVNELNAIADKGRRTGDDEVGKGLQQLGQILESQPVPSTPDADIADLDAELEAALSQFDGLLLAKLDTLRNDMDQVNDATSEALSPHAQAAAEAAALLRRFEEEAVGPAEASGEPTSTTASTAPEAPASKPGREQDADIVARQLREAAEKEKDPALREKLWKEYEDYVGRGAGSI